jgi:hypothetical protein
LARERCASLKPNEQVADFVGSIRLYQDDGQLGLLEGPLE